MNIDGKYYDGKSPISTPVSCIITADGLILINQKSEKHLAEWKKSDIYQDENHNTVIVLAHRFDKSKLELINTDIAVQLGISGQKNLVKGDHRIIYKWFGIVAAACALLWILLPIATNFIAVRIPYSLEVSATSSMKFDSYFKLCSLSSEQEKGLKIYADYLYPKNAMEEKMPITFKVADNLMINAFTFPGGRVVLMKGLLKEVKTPEELLGVMGHEIGHVVARDSAGFFVRGALLASFFGFLTGDFHSSFAVSPQILLSTAALTFDRDMEMKADAYAANRLTLLNVSTSGLRSFFSRLNTDQKYAVPEIMMNHPNFDSRLSLIKETYPKNDLPREISDNWDIVRKICQ